MYYTETIDIEQRLNQKKYLVNIVVSQMNLRNNNILDYDDFLSIGLIGLYDALNKFDPTKNKNFDDYAKLRIRGAILDELRRVGEISRGRISKLNDYYKVVNEMREANPGEPNDDDVIKELGIEKEELNDLYEVMHFLSKDSLDQIVFDDVSYMDQIESKSFESPESSLLNKERNQELSNAISHLDERMQLILQLIYVEELSLKEISEVLDISISRVSQLHGKALTLLRGKLTKEIGD